ncbi:hypothetical protein FANTH_12405 [Fusarium anthophilum]|uniref:Uncharacterized protein n=1 Tax=Fusarium anthophilum TaxID=48485 RepID=A0A8H5DSB7_9HYPO|nr:hypothetical protein FANTH_12405 [Fusarium anthophilum]
MTHHENQLPWEDLASVFQLKHTNTCQHGAYNLHVLAHPDSKTKLVNFLNAFIQSVTEDSTRQRKQYPQKYRVPNEDEVIISDEVAARITPTVRRWHPEKYSPSKDEHFETFQQPCLKGLCIHTNESDTCGCALPFKERKMAAFQRDKIETDCHEFEKYNEEAYRNLNVVRTLILHGDMDAVLRSCAYKGSHLSDWWQETYGIKMYIILNLLHFFPESWDRDGVPVDDYRNIKAYQLAIRSCTKTEYLGDVAMYPHWDFFGIKKGQFKRYPKPFDVPRWKHFMKLERDGYCFWFHDDDTADDGEGLKANDGSIERSPQDPDDYYAYTLTFYPYGLISYDEFLNFETPVGHQINPSDVTHVRWILCQKGLPVEISNCILEYADYTPRGSLPLSGKPLHPQCKQELDRYLDYCWQLIVRCCMLGYELKDKMDIESLLRVEVKDSLSELFRSPDESEVTA